MWRRRFLVLLVSATSAVLTSTSGGSDIIYTTLDNGMEVVLKENHAAPVASVRVYVRTGSIYEQEYLGCGISHMFEHLLNGGTTTTRSEDESRRIVESIGNASNAYTTKDHTCYYITTTSQHVETALELLADWVMNAAFTEKEFEREHQVVQREIEQRSQSPHNALYQLASRTMFRVHPAGIPIIGYAELVRKLKREDIIDYYQRMYVPSNVVVVAVGDFDSQKFLEKVKATFKDFQRRPVPAVVLPSEPVQLGKRVAVEEMDVKSAYLRLSFRTVPLAHADLYPLDVMSFILSRGESSRLVKTIKDEQRLVHVIRTWSHTPAYDGGQFVVDTQLEAAKLDDAQEAVLAELYRLKDELVTEDELEKAKKQKIASDVFGRQTVEGQASDLGWNTLAAHDPDFSTTYVAHIQKVTKAQVREVARKYFADDRLCVAIVRPKTAEGEKDVSATDASSAVQKFVLQNGARVLAKQNPGLPVVVMQAFFLAGTRVETEANCGLTHLTAKMLTRGTQTRSADDIASAFDRMGGTIAGSSGAHTLYVSAKCLKGDFQGAFEVFSDVVLNPSFNAEELDKQRTLLLAQIRRQKDSPQREGHLFFLSKFFKKSPYRFLSTGTEQSVSALKRDDLARFHGKHCVPNNLVLAVFGDISAEQVREAAQKYFASVPAAEGFAVPSAPVEPPLESSVVETQETKKRTAVLWIGWRGMTLADHQDRYAIDVLDTIVSGKGFPGGWLHSDLRGKGLVYMVHAFNRPYLEPGYFAALAVCQPANAKKTVGLILKHVEKVKAGSFTDDELETAKNICVTMEHLDKQTNSDLAMEAALNELYGFGYDLRAKYAGGVAAVTRAEVERVAKKYLTKHVVAICSPKVEKKVE